MGALVDAVRSRVSDRCCVAKCSKKGCSVPLPKELRPFVVIDMDHCDSPTAKSGKRCDFIFVSQRWVAPMELKKGKANASEIVPQLQAGASVVDELVPDDATVDFRPVAAYGGGLHKHERNAFRKKRIRFRQQREIVRLIRCGAPLPHALHAS